MGRRGQRACGDGRILPSVHLVVSTGSSRSPRGLLGAFTSQAPPPATIFLFTIARLTIMIASCRLRSTSAMNCSAPPLRTSVHVFAAGQPSKKLNRSPPICRSSNRAHVPRCWGWMSEQVDEMLPPVACTTLSKSSDETRPAQKTSRSAKYLRLI